MTKRSLLTRIRNRIRLKRLAIMALFLGTGAILGAASLAIMTAGLLYDYRDTIQIEAPGRLPQVGYIVCLAGGKGRIETASRLWHRYWVEDPERVPTLYMAGMGPQAGWTTFLAQVPPSIAPHIQRHHVHLENKSSDTAENATEFQAYLSQQPKEKQILSLALVTSTYHMRRSRLLFERVLVNKNRIEMLSVEKDFFKPTTWTQSPYSTRVTLMEYLKWVYLISLP